MLAGKLHKRKVSVTAVCSLNNIAIQTCNYNCANDHMMFTQRTNQLLEIYKVNFSEIKIKKLQGQRYFALKQSQKKNSKIQHKTADYYIYSSYKNHMTGGLLFRN